MKVVQSNKVFILRPASCSSAIKVSEQWASAPGVQLSADGQCEWSVKPNTVSGCFQTAPQCIHSPWLHFDQGTIKSQCFWICEMRANIVTGDMINRQKTLNPQRAFWQTNKWATDADNWSFSQSFELWMKCVDLGEIDCCCLESAHPLCELQIHNRPTLVRSSVIFPLCTKMAEVCEHWLLIMYSDHVYFSFLMLRSLFLDSLFMRTVNAVW